jgi:uroporphyrinogen decarboxylase
VPDGVWIYEDLGYRNGLYCSPAILEELIFPYYAEMVDFFHGYNLPVVLHACGNISEALPIIVVAGFDALNPMEVKAGCDALAFAEPYAENLAFIGGLDARILESGDQNLIRRGVTNLMEGMKERGARFVFGSDHSVSTNVTFAFMKFACEVYREHMYY